MGVRGFILEFVKELWKTPKDLSVASKFTISNGVFYMSIGGLFVVWPGAVQTLFFESELVGREADLVRVLGLTIAIIGWFYFIGGRTGATQMVAASVLNRVALVPAVLIPLAISGVFPNLLWGFAILDPTLGVIAWCLLFKGTDGVGDEKDRFRRD